MNATIAVAMVLGILLLVAAVLATVFGALFLAGRGRREAIAADGLILRSGARLLTVSGRSYRGPDGISLGGFVRKNFGEALLTSSGLHVVGVGFGRGAGSIHLQGKDLEKCRVWAEGGVLHVATTEPPAATGDVELRFRPADAESFANALYAAGAGRG
jgi:hypothetical protein